MLHATQKRRDSGVLWVAAACGVGFGCSTIFAGFFHLPRTRFLLPYVLASCTLLHSFLRSQGVSLHRLWTERWRAGVVGATLVSIFGIASVLRQPAGTRPEGVSLVLMVLWAGVVYGAVDALLLTVLPVLAIQDAGDSGRPNVTTVVVGLTANLAITAAYHVGFPEFRGAALIAPLLGNAAFTLAYLLTRSPLAPMLGHMAMHTAAVLHGMESTVQLPPHY